MRGRHALIPVVAVALFGLHHWMTRAAWLIDYDPATIPHPTYETTITGWAVALEAWPLVLLGAVIGSVAAYALSGVVHRGRAARDATARELDWQQEHEQMIAINRTIWDEKIRAERRVESLDVELRQAQEALACAERRVQNAACKAERWARKVRAARDNSAALDD